jgi:multidrug efflux pump subunit AcrB
MDKLEQAASSLNGNFQFLDTETGEISTEIVDHFIIIGRGVSSGIATIELDKDVPNQIDSDLITEYLLNYVGNMPGLKSLTFSAGQVFGGNPISYQLVSNNPEELTAAASELENKLHSYNGLINIKNEAVKSKDELRLQLLPRAEVMGFTLSDLSTQVRNAFYGSQAQRLQRDDDEVRVMVRYPEEERISIGDLEDMYIRTSEGDAVPFTSIANFDMQPGYAQINRVDGEQSVAVNSDIIEAMVEPNVVNNDIKNNFFPELKTRYPSVDFREDGGTAEQQSIIEDMVRGMIFAIFGIYALLAIPLRSYTQPIIIMGVIPFGMVGAIVGHIVVGIPVNFLSFLGIIALSGVVVNDSIILVNFVNNATQKGENVIDAVVNGGARRFRAILLTSLTTFFGLLPILLETSMQAQFLIPMATSLAFGIVFATVITLLLIPCLYVMLEDLKGTKLEAPAINTGSSVAGTA